MTATLNRPTCVIGQTSLYLDDLAPQSAAEITERVQAFYRDFPAAARLLQDVKTEPNEFILWPDSLAITAPVDDRTPAPPYQIFINREFFGPGRRERIEQISRQKYDEGWFSVPEPRGTIEHELGHILDLATSYWYGLPRSRSAMLSSLTRNAAQTVSGYATSAPQEAFAEAFAGCRLGYRTGDMDMQHAVAAILSEVRGHA